MSYYILLGKAVKQETILLFFLILSVSFGQEKLYRNAFALADVSLLEGPFRQARDLNIEILLKYDVDRLLAPYRKEAGLQPRDSSYVNWIGLDGHIAGHYLSAMAMNYAATGNAQCKQRMDYMISELQSCQQASLQNNKEWGKGYVGGVPGSSRVWPDLKKGDFTAYRKSWVPWYNLHKMYAGLRDAWLYGGSEQAKAVFLKFCDWAVYITEDLADAQMESMLDTEHGGMNEIFADAFQISDDSRYLTAAKRFSHRQLLDTMANGIDNLDNKHANTQVPKAVGFQRIAELSGDENYTKAARFFWETVTGNRTLAFGGNSRKEHFPSKKASSDYINDVEGPETCNTHNMLKLTEDLFRVTAIPEYADFYERALFNHILSSQHPGHGGYVYFTPARPQHYRVYSQPNQAMWCCVGTGMENHGKYGSFIYTHNTDSLFLNLFIASELNWREKGIIFMQKTDFPEKDNTRLHISKGSAQFTLMIRYPSWVDPGALEVIINNEAIFIEEQPSSYIPVKRLWQAGDVIDIKLPMHTTIETLPDTPQYIAFLHGPVLLASRSGTQDLAGLVADDSRWGHIAHGHREPVDKAPVIVEKDHSEIANRIKPLKKKPLHFEMSGLNMINPRDLVLEPFYRIHDARYIMYWMTFSDKGYQSYLDSVAIAEKEKLALHKRTVDFVAPGEQQPEADHLIESENSKTGNYWDEFWRDARDGGYFSYRLSTDRQSDLSVMVRYWGYEWGSHKFHILIDDQKLVSEDNSGRWYQSDFKDIIYPIPDTMVQGKDNIRLKFEAMPGSTAGPVYFIRLLKQ